MREGIFRQYKKKETEEKKIIHAFVVRASTEQ